MSSTTRILYVEDEPLLARIVQESLQSRGFHVVWLDHGAGVVTAIEQGNFDICVLDVMLPHTDGFTLAAQVRARRPGLPIIFLTARAQAADVVKGFQAGGNDYLRKPFSMEELIVRIQNLLALTRSDGVATAPLRVGRYCFHPDRYELQLGEQRRILSYREAQLLGMLLRPGQEIVLRQELLLAIWGDDSFFNSRNLDVYIRKLRAYLAADPTVKILTLRGVGYRVVID